MMLLKYCTQYASKFGKLSNSHRTGKGQFSFQSQRRAMPKNVRTTSYKCTHFTCQQGNAQNPSSQAFQQHVNGELPDVQSEFRKGRGTRDQIANIHWIMKKGNLGKTSTSASLTTLKPLTAWITTNCGKFLKRREYQTTLPAS